MCTIQEYLDNGGKVNLVELTENYLKKKDITIQELSVRVGLSRSAVSQYLSGKYGNPSSVESKLIPYLHDEGVTIDTQDESCNPFLQVGQQFFESTDARRIVAVCSACQEFSVLGVIAGKSGYGKTYALKQYANLPKVVYIECDDTMGRRDMVEAIESALGLNQGYGTLYRRTEIITSHLNKHPGYLIIVDEADKLISKSTQKKMEILRKLVDQSKVGMVIAGEPQLIPLLKSYDVRFANRGSYSYVLSGLDKTEVNEYLSKYPMEQQAQDELMERACNTRNGCFRLLDRTLSNVIRLVKDRKATQITLDMIEEASDMMML